MPEFEPTTDSSDTVDEQTQDEDLADAYEALEEDRRQQTALAQTQQSTAVDPAKSDAAPVEGVHAGDALPDSTVPPTAEPAKSAPQGDRRVFLIDGKEYPDPDPSLPITGTRSVQAMYRDYFPGQLDNADVVQKTRHDGMLEVTFKRRIGTKGTGRAPSRLRPSPGRGEVVVDVGHVTALLADLPEDRPLAWALVAQATGPDGDVRLDYVPDVSQLNLAEAQVTARTRLIDLAVSELSRLRPCP